MNVFDVNINKLCETINYSLGIIFFDTYKDRYEDFIKENRNVIAVAKLNGKNGWVYPFYLEGKYLIEDSIQEIGDDYSIITLGRDIRKMQIETIKEYVFDNNIYFNCFLSSIEVKNNLAIAMSACALIEREINIIGDLKNSKSSYSVKLNNSKRKMIEHFKNTFKSNISKELICAKIWPSLLEYLHILFSSDDNKKGVNRNIIMHGKLKVLPTDEDITKLLNALCSIVWINYLIK